MKDLNDLYYFAQVVRHGGFAAAARATGIQKSLLSRRVRLLEDRLHTLLIQRSSRHFSVTETGRAFFDRCTAILQEAEAAEQAIAQLQSEPCGVIRVSCPVTLLNFQFAALFARFIARHPAVTLELDSTNRRVDPREEELDLAIRVRFPPLEPENLVMRVLDSSTQCLVAAPSLVPSPLPSPADLTSLPSLDFNTGPASHGWNLEGPDGETAMIFHEPRLITDNMTALREAALIGIGVVQLPTMMVWQDVQEGRLVQVLPGWRPRAGTVHAIFPSRRGLSPAVRALLDFLATECAAQRRTISLALEDRLSDAASP
ncbi:LysR family transcriptional regulator [Neoasaia chiangmaiensis NBRC 101099]|uniref:LysR family transcriptional regulator n=1 Tax=Neoasaia chiangmaiensis TaxID=320497 RepID=A0A1U9KQI1_9PROT|nr:LysR substrate-binding domain-containing protein [Neoasaia chiangmaiensis]AQS88045.1 LysR family transcriptional regulator [Neoasaia chiangmaiensis]GBR38795.1 LysR family transcriptional regulator [Neoasaia chiangmaiensis NBRC 101099]GEN15719.1 LysR family transcriptional regulator [Neoasaia chiangmaiensis]